MTPKTYSEWHECITVKCKIRLTVDFALERLKALENYQDPQTKRFCEIYGETHRQQVVSWMQKALEELQHPRLK